MSANPFRDLPAIGTLLEEPAIRALRQSHGHEAVVEALRIEIVELRSRLFEGESLDRDALPDRIAAWIERRLLERDRPHLRTVINATGIVLHTNLGRSPLADVAAKAAYDAARGYINLEIDLVTGERSSRQDAIQQLLRPLLKCESATAVNNCAAATVITLRALAAGKEVIVSRGQLVEIGGSFRIPEIMAASGAILREVGTTNITRIEDYERAIGPNTGLLMRIHQSNFRQRGFTHAANLAELVALAEHCQIPLVDDVGSGAMFDFAALGLPGDPVVGESLAAGADLVLFSGDKLLGGPQAGLIAGRRDLVALIERDPLMRAFRLDKMSLAALEATLRLYRDTSSVRERIPILKMLSQTLDQLRTRAVVFAEQLRSFPGLSSVEVREDTAFAGGGSLPDVALPTVVIAIQAEGMNETMFAARLRDRDVLARVHEGRVCLDLRTVFAEQETSLVEAIRVAATMNPSENS